MANLREVIDAHVTEFRGSPPTDKFIDEMTEDFVSGDDGFYIYWPMGEGSRGGYTSAHLRLIANILDDVNEEWANIVEKEFSKE